jgi:hypothetical protein
LDFWRRRGVPLSTVCGPRRHDTPLGGRDVRLGVLPAELRQADWRPASRRRCWFRGLSVR